MPKFVGHEGGTAGSRLVSFEVENAALRTFKIVVAIGGFTTSKSLGYARHQLETHLYIIAYLDARTVGRTVKVLYDAHAVHIVEVDVIGDTHRHPLDEHRGIFQRDVQAA